MAVLRAAEEPVATVLVHQAPADLGFEPQGIGIPLAALHRLNAAPEQLERALAGLLGDGLAELHQGGFRLPG
jgi:A/G-specific adenine glycosylase